MYVTLKPKPLLHSLRITFAKNVKPSWEYISSTERITFFLHVFRKTYLSTSWRLIVCEVETDFCCRYSVRVSHFSLFTVCYIFPKWYGRTCLQRHWLINQTIVPFYCSFYFYHWIGSKLVQNCAVSWGHDLWMEATRPEKPYLICRKCKLNLFLLCTKEPVVFQLLKTMCTA